jgi:hypothetical protein
MPVEIDGPIRRTTPNVIAADRNYIKPMVSFLTREPNIARGIKVKMPGGTVIEFNGKTTEIRRGLVQTDFIPKRGRINRTTVIPEIPIVSAPEVTRVPAKIGLRINFGVGIAGLAAWLQANQKELLDLFEEVAKQLRVQEDFDLANDTLTATAVQVEPLMAKIGAATLTRNKTKGPERFRIHARSRR